MSWHFYISRNFFISYCRKFTHTINYFNCFYVHKIIPLIHSSCCRIFLGWWWWWFFQKEKKSLRWSCKFTISFIVQDPYKNLLNWLKDGKAEFSKVEIEVRSERYRTLKAKTHINVIIINYLNFRKGNGYYLFQELISLHLMKSKKVVLSTEKWFN